MNPRRCLSSLLRLLPLLVTAPAFAGGRIVVANDDWTLSNQGFTNAPDTDEFARNVADWFTGGAAGNFLVYSNNFGLTGTTLQQTMLAAGHTWTISTAVTFDAPTLLQYDAVFVGGFAANNAVLTNYVAAGGSVYILGGTGWVDEATAYNTFLNAFGLSFANGYDGITGLIPTASSHPLFTNVDDLYQSNGSTITDLAPSDPAQSVLVASGVGGLYAIYDGGTPHVYCAAKVNSLGCTPAIHWTGTPSASNTTPFTIGASNVLNNKNGLFFYGTHGRLNAPFQGGTLCVKAPLKRTHVQNSGGNPPPNDCTGTYAFDFNAHIASGIDPLLVAGATVDGQYWSRDQGFAPPNNTGLTDAIEFVVGP